MIHTGSVISDPWQIMGNADVDSRFLSFSATVAPVHDANLYPSALAFTLKRSAGIAPTRIFPAFDVSGTEHCRFLEVRAVPVRPLAEGGRQYLHCHLPQHIWQKICCTPTKKKFSSQRELPYTRAYDFYHALACVKINAQRDY